MSKNRMNINTLHKSLLIVLCVVGFAGCGNKGSVESSTLESISSFSISEDELAAYVESKGIKNKQGERYKRTVQAFIEQNALASVISTDPKSLTTSTRVDIKRKRNEILINNYLNNHVVNLVTADFVEKYYKDNIDQYSTRKVKVLQILLPIPQGVSDSKRLGKREEAIKLAEMLRNGGDFSEAVKNYSADTLDEIKWLIEGKGDQIIVDAALSMKVDDISEPIDSPHGMQIIKLLEDPVSEVTELDDIRDKIVYELKYEAKLGELKRLKALASHQVQDDLDKQGLN
ncbi:MAG: peptidylprolyl isomerase [Sedimenticola sp.]